MVDLTITPTIHSALLALPPSSHTAFPTSLSPPPPPGSPISHTDLITLSKTLRSQDVSNERKYTLNSLLRGTSLHNPPPPQPPPPSAEYLALKARLLAEQEAASYRRMTASTISSSAKNPADHDDITPSLVFNIFLSVLLCGFAVFWATRFWPSLPLRVLVAMGSGIIVGVAEVGVYAAYLRKVEEARGKEMKKKERKRVVGPVGDGVTKTEKGSAAEEIDVGGKESTEIWGKGVNGGARRRVREKWEKEQERD